MDTTHPEIGEIASKIDWLIAARAELKTEVQLLVKNKEIPLDQRWSIFVLSDLGDHYPGDMDAPGINWNKVTLYDDFYTDRGGHLNTNDMYNMAVSKKLFKTDEDHILFKEYFLNEFVKSFTAD